MNTQNPFDLLIKALQNEFRQCIQEEIYRAFSQLHLSPLKEEEVLNIDEAAMVLKMAKKTLYRLVAQRQIPFSKAGGRLVFLRSELMEWLKSNKAETRSETLLKAEEQLLSKNKRRCL